MSQTQSHLQSEQVLTLISDNSVRTDLNSAIEKLTCQELAIGFNRDSIDRRLLRAIQVLQRSERIGLIFQNGDRSYLAIKKEVLESLGGLNLALEPGLIFQDLYDRLNVLRTWGAIQMTSS